MLKNVGLTAELLARLEDLRASRQRLVAAQDEERRRLERNLHDGAQQNLVAIKIKLGLAEVARGQGPRQGEGHDRSAQGRHRRGAGDAARPGPRDLPAAAGRQGPGCRPCESQARKASLPAEGSASEPFGATRRTSKPRCTSVLEALQNVQKYAGATMAEAALSASDTQLRFEVRDDGKGFDIASIQRGAD